MTVHPDLCAPRTHPLIFWLECHVAQACYHIRDNTELCVAVSLNICNVAYGQKSCSRRSPNTFRCPYSQVQIICRSNASNVCIIKYKRGDHPPSPLPVPHLSHQIRLRTPPLSPPRSPSRFNIISTCTRTAKSHETLAKSGSPLCLAPPVGVRRRCGA